MKKLLNICLIALFLGVSAQAQDLSELKDAALKKLGLIETPNTFTGYFNLTDVGFLIGSPDNARIAPFSFMTVNGAHLTEQFSLGLGLGLEFPTGSYMPIVVDARYYLRNESFSPFFSLYSGYAVPLDDDGYYAWQYAYDYSSSFYYEDYQSLTPRGGWLVNPGFGFRHMFGPNFGVIFGMGYRFQRLYYQGTGDRQVITDYSRLSLKFGITFR